MLRSSSSIPLLALVLALLFPQGAEASWFQPHTIQEDVPFKDVERSLHGLFDVVINSASGSCPGLKKGQAKNQRHN